MQPRGYVDGGGADLIHRAKHRADRFALREGRAGRFDAGAKRRRRIFGHRANGARPAAAETAGATRPWRIHAETFVRGPGARTERCARAARCRRRPGRHLRRGGQGIARLRRHQLDLGDRRRLFRDVHAGRLRLPRDRLLARQERGHGHREDRHQLLDRRDHVLGGRLRVRVRRPARPRHRDPRLLPARLRRSAAGLPDHGPVGRDGRVEVVLPVRLLRRLARHRVGHDARAHQVRRLRHLRGRLQRADLPDRLGLGLRRRLAAGQPRHAGLRRLDGGPPDRRDRRPRRAAAARRRATASTGRTASRGRSPATTCRCSASA